MQGAGRPVGCAEEESRGGGGGSKGSGGGVEEGEEGGGQGCEDQHEGGEAVNKKSRIRGFNVVISTVIEWEPEEWE